MSLSISQENAVDEILAAIKAAWDPTTFPIYWEEKPQNRAATNVTSGLDVPFVKVHVRHGFSNQTTLGGEGYRTFRRTGNVICQLFIPAGQGLSSGYINGKLLVDAFEGKRTPGGVWFRETKLEEVTPDGSFFQFNITSAFEYTEVK